MAYVTPGTVAAGDVATAAAWNVITNDVIDHETRILALPRGYKGGTTLATTFSTTSTSYVDVTALSVTFTAEASRRYLVTFECNVESGTVAGSTIVINDLTSNIAEGYHIPVTNGITHISLFAVTTPSAGSVTYKIRTLVGSAGTMIVHGTSTRGSLAARLLVMDIGAA